MEKGVLNNIVETSGKHRCWSLFLNKVAGLRYATLLKKGPTPTQGFSYEFCEIFQSIYLLEYLQTAASVFSILPSIFHETFSEIS